MRDKFSKQQEKGKSQGKNRSSSKTHQFRQVITKINSNYPKDHYIAYCIVSKQSKNGFFLNQRLLVLDTFHQQLKYYSRIPFLPLQRPQDLIVPKEVIKFKAIKNLQFIPQKIRIGHVVVKWKINKQHFSWKLIMGSNRIAKQFSEIVYNAIKMHQQRLAKQSSALIQQTTRGNMNEDKKSHNQKQLILKQAIFNKQKSKASAPSNLNNKIIDRISLNQSKQKKINYSQLQQIQLKSQSSFSIKDSIANILIDDQVKVQKKQSIINLKSQSGILQIKKFRGNERSNHNLQNSLTLQWLQSHVQKDKAAIYNKFVHKCFKKIEELLQNFVSSHMNHEQMGSRCIIRDENMTITYVPIIQSTSSQILPQSLIRKIRQQQQLLRQWQSLNFISGYLYLSKYKILTPMCCILIYKSFKFFCKSNIQFYHEIVKVEHNEISSQIKELQEKCHVKICNGNEVIFKIDNQLCKTIYFDKLSCLPQFYNGLPIQYNIIENYVLEGKINNSKDVEALSTFINSKLIAEVTTKLKENIIISTVQLMQIIQDYGLSQHYLPMFIDKSCQDEQKIDHFSRLIYTEMLACAFEWQMRKRMQLQIFKNKEFGFSIHQIQLCLNLFFQQDQYFFTVLNNHLIQYFKCRIPENGLPLQKYIINKCFLISIFIRLSLNCKLSIQESDFTTWYWKQSNIYNNMQLIPFISSQFLRVECFSLNPKLFRKFLVQDMSFQINKATTVDHVFKCLNVKNDNMGGCQIPPLYDCLSIDIKKKINFYLSHFISPLSTNTVSLQQQIYFDQIFYNYNANSLQYLTSLNKARWLIKAKKIHQADIILSKQIQKAIIWGHNSILVHLYNFSCKYKIANGQINNALNYSLKAFNYAKQLYKLQRSLLVDLLVAQQAFESANLHFSVHNFTKALQLYSTAEQILNEIKTDDEQIKLNAQFMKVYINKSSIYLMFNERQNCLDSCLLGLKNINKFNSEEQKGNINKYEFKIYTILFRCYQINKMRKQMLQISQICSSKYFQDKVSSTNDPDPEIVIEIVKMLWISIIKQTEISHVQAQYHKIDIKNLKLIDLRKVKQQILSLKRQFGNTYRYSTKQIIMFLGGQLQKKNIHQHEWPLSNQIISCLIFVSTHNRQRIADKLYDLNNIESNWLLLQSLTILAGYSYLVGQIEDSMHIYSYQI